jgi:hypothetical protein
MRGGLLRVRALVRAVACLASASAGTEDLGYQLRKAALNGETDAVIELLSRGAHADVNTAVAASECTATVTERKEKL